MTDDWGPWINHDGKGCPVARGTIVEVLHANGEEEVYRALCNFRPGWPGAGVANLWDWSTCQSYRAIDYRIVQYRVQKPRALVALIGMVEGLGADRPDEAVPA